MSVALTRREFLLYGAAALGAGALASAGLKLPRLGAASLPSAAPAPAAESIVPSLCTMCPSSCGLNVRVVDGKAVKLEGNSLHPVNQGVCCPKGQASLEVLYSPERILGPLARTDRRASWTPIAWDDALALAASKLRDLRRRDEAHTVAAVYGQTRGQMQTIVRRLLAAYGSPNAIQVENSDTHATRLGMFLTQGINGLPVYQFEQTRYAISFGGSILESNRHLLSALAGTGFLRRGTAERGKLVVVDPRLSVSAAKADEWIPIRPGALGAFALGMAYVIVHSGLYDQKFVEDYTFGFDDFADDAGQIHRGFKSLLGQEYTLDRAEAITGVPGGTIARLAGEFAASRPAIAISPTEGSALANGNGLGTAMAVHALNALVGSVDAPGGVIVQRYPKLVDWPAFTPDDIAARGTAHDRIDGAGTAAYPFADSALNLLPERVLSRQPYPINSVLLCDADPVFATSAGSLFAQALDAIPFVVSLSPVLDESAAHADLILPVATSFESWNDAYVEGTGFPGIAISQPAVKPVHDVRSAEDVLLGLAQQLGGSVAAALPWRDLQTLLRFRVSGSGIDWDGLVRQGAWSQMVYTNAEPGSKVWSSQVVGTDRLNAPRDGRFDFFSREMFYALVKAGISPSDRDCLPHFDPPADTGDESNYPFILDVCEVMPQPSGWSAVVPTLQEVYGLQDGVRWDSWVELNRQAAGALAIASGDWVWVESRRGRLKTRAKVTEGLWPNAAAMPLGQGHATHVQWGRGSVDSGTVGVNPLGLCENSVDKWSALPNAPARVKIYKA